MVVLRALLFPFSILYDLVTRIRNYLYDIGHKRSFRFEASVVSIGNLNVGGSGKTPMIEYLTKLLSAKGRVAILSRGYGRKTRGLRFAAQGDTAKTIGDEPFQLFRKFGNEITVTVCEDRAFAIPHILQQIPTPEVILLDDAFQHRSVDPQLSILVTDYSRPFYRDFLLPAGDLREARAGAKRSHLIVVTKCPSNLSSSKMDSIRKSIQLYAPQAQVYFTGLQYGSPVSFSSQSELAPEAVLVSGIGNSAPLEDFVNSTFKVIKHFRYRDHHNYLFSEVAAIGDYCRGLSRPVSVVTTEKDMVKLIDPALAGAMGSTPWFYLPVQMYFLENGSDFDSVVVRLGLEDFRIKDRPIERKN